MLHRDENIPIGEICAVSLLKDQTASQATNDSGLVNITRHLPIRGIHWLVLVISLIATLTAWQLSLSNSEERSRKKFELHADYAVELLRKEINRYADILKAGVGFVAANNDIQPKQWRNFVQRIAVAEQFTAISGMGIIYRVELENLDSFVREQRRTRPEYTIRPPLENTLNSARQFVLPVGFAYPEALEKKLPGFDISQDPRRLNGIERTIATGSVQITAPITPETTTDAGFVLMAPIFKTALPETPALRQSEFVGAVVAAVTTKNLAQGILDSRIRQVAIQVSDDTEVLYSELHEGNDDLDPQALMTQSRTLSFFGRDWLFEIHSTQAFREEQRNLTPTIVLIGGLIIDVLLLLLFLYMSRANIRAIKYGDKILHKYEDQSQHLQFSNNALEARNEQLKFFSFAVSHDLKAPLRSVGFLAECIQEDIEDDRQNLTLPPDLEDHIQRIRKQVALSQGLIKGILEYSGIGVEKATVEHVNVRELLHSFQDTLSVDAEQLHLDGSFPTFKTYKTQLTQVLMNLINNGYKYHHGQCLSVVRVSASLSPLKGFYRFTVSDNGPGIAPAYHKKIFEPFSTLQSKDHSMSSGVGLAIVKNLVSQHGGEIEINSNVGQGASFTFDWPCAVDGENRSNEDTDLPKAA